MSDYFDTVAGLELEFRAAYLQPDVWDKMEPGWRGFKRYKIWPFLSFCNSIFDPSKRRLNILPRHGSDRHSSNGLLDHQGSGLLNICDSIQVSLLTYYRHMRMSPLSFIAFQMISSRVSTSSRPTESSTLDVAMGNSPPLTPPQ